FQLPERRVTVNLAPAGRRKEGAAADLAIALGVLIATAQAPPERLAGAAAIGELALDGTLRPVRGTLSLAEALWRGGATRLRSARLGKDHARAPSRRDPAVARSRRGTGGDATPLHRGAQAAGSRPHGAAAVPRAPSQRLPRRSDRRRHAPAPRRDLARASRRA